MKYRKKPVTIEAVQFYGFAENNENILLSERPEWLTSQFGKKVLFFDEINKLSILTLEGTMKVSIGDYIIKGINHEFYPCKPDIFEKTYELVEE